MATTANNLQALARYDRFLGNVSLFLSAQARNDRFQGLDLRQQVDPGVAYYFINEKTTQLWVELGYDLLFDVRRNDSRVQLDADKKPAVDAAGQPLPLLAKTRTIHSARGFIGFEYVLNEGSKLVAGIEALQGLAGSESNTKEPVPPQRRYRALGQGVEIDLAGPELFRAVRQHAPARQAEPRHGRSPPLSFTRSSRSTTTP